MTGRTPEPLCMCVLQDESFTRIAPYLAYIPCIYTMSYVLYIQSHDL